VDWDRPAVTQPAAAAALLAKTWCATRKSWTSPRRTQQIQLLIIARRLSGKTSAQLR
jgi:hypothetical protein